MSILQCTVVTIHFILPWVCFNKLLTDKRFLMYFCLPCVEKMPKKGKLWIEKTLKPELKIIFSWQIMCGTSCWFLHYVLSLTRRLLHPLTALCPPSLPPGGALCLRHYSLQGILVILNYGVWFGANVCQEEPKRMEEIPWCQAHEHNIAVKKLKWNEGKKICQFSSCNLCFVAELSLYNFCCCRKRIIVNRIIYLLKFHRSSHLKEKRWFMDFICLSKLFRSLMFLFFSFQWIAWRQVSCER